LRTRIVRIGNSRGVRIPKLLLEQSGLEGEVEMNAEDGSLLIRSIAKRRAGWAKAFREMADQGDDALLADLPAAVSSWDEDEWEWS
jgi:antitoxin MazE